MKKNLEKTLESCEAILDQSKDIFVKKSKDYGLSWLIMRPSSITDQIYIKALRVREIQETKENRVGEAIENEFLGMINYACMALIKIRYSIDEVDKIDENIAVQEVIKMYEKEIKETLDLMRDKNHDYGEAWRKMRVESITDIMLMKIMRIKQIEDNDGKTNISEGIDANYRDIINYALFASIHLSEKNEAI